MLKHYIIDANNNHPIDLKINKEALGMLIECAIDHWYYLIENTEYTSSTKDQIRKDFQDFLFSIERVFYEVAYDYHIEEALGQPRIGGKETTIEEDYANEPEKLALLTCYKDWIAQGMIKREFPLWLHDQLMSIGLNVLLTERGGDGN